MKKRNVLNLYKTILELENRVYSTKFGYFLSKTKIAIQPEINTCNNKEMF